MDFRLAKRRRIVRGFTMLMYLGVDTIRSLVLSTNVFSQFESAQSADFSLEVLLNHSLQTAVAAKTLALEEGVEQKLMDEAFVAGMLHDTGKLVLAANFPDQFKGALHEAAREKLVLTAAEKKFFGADHADVGGYLLGLWGLPAPVVEAIALHHCPSLAVQKTFSSLTAVHVGNVLVQEHCRPNPIIPASQMDKGYLAELGLQNRLDTWRAAWRNISSNEASGNEPSRNATEHG